MSTYTRTKKKRNHKDSKSLSQNNCSFNSHNRPYIDPLNSRNFKKKE